MDTDTELDRPAVIAGCECLLDDIRELLAQIPDDTPDRRLLRVDLRTAAARVRTVRWSEEIAPISDNQPRS